MNAELYTPSMRRDWNDFLDISRNATFLFHRDFMDYHRDRFVDGSLIFRDESKKVRAVLPANINDNTQTVYSHQGLTYGGLLTSPQCTISEVREMLIGAANYYLERGAKQFIYKPTPYIYHRYPAQEVDYWLFRAGMQLEARGVAQVIDLRSPLQFSQLRNRKVKRATAQGIQIIEGRQKHLEDFWTILTNTLQERHGVKPVHTISEMQYLMQKFPNDIRLYVAINKDGDTIAGIVIFDACPVRHIQYISASAEGRQYGALDALFNTLIQQTPMERFTYFDFGISTEKGGLHLNEGLTFQKEGFGGRAICYDTYSVPLTKLQNI